MSRWKVGDVVHSNAWVGDLAQYNGEGLKIAGDLRMRLVDATREIMGYLIQCPDGSYVVAAPHRLMDVRCPLPQKQLIVEWDSCEWQPKRDSLDSGE